MKIIITGLPVVGPVIISVFSCLHRKMNTQGGEDTRSGHILFYTIFPCTNIFGTSLNLLCFSSILCVYPFSKPDILMSALISEFQETFESSQFV